MMRTFPVRDFDAPGRCAQMLATIAAVSQPYALAGRPGECFDHIGSYCD